ncbi:hypothetical protein TNCT_322851 [Trichonephila clavata]|uniref:Secreted protein n=1 Tax=Trichonephila clavata TaxID=2740835 RepID=A0A8X6LAE3_TRICU|nr:hypothetical protein TNCT_322851 [Trichonephila clavata]
MLLFLFLSLYFMTLARAECIEVPTLLYHTESSLSLSCALKKIWRRLLVVNSYPTHQERAEQLGDAYQAISLRLRILKVGKTDSSSADGRKQNPKRSCNEESRTKKTKE